jgi:hypothetical protein
LFSKRNCTAAAPDRGILSRDNQAHLKHKSSAFQSDAVAAEAWSGHVNGGPMAASGDLSMTETKSISKPTRRNEHGSIDFDFYRTRATALRGQARRESRSLRAIAAGALVMVGAIGFALVIPSAPKLGERIAAHPPGTFLVR